MKIVKYKRPISDCLLCYMRIIVHIFILAVTLHAAYFVLTHYHRVTLRESMQMILYKLDKWMPV